MDCLFCWIETDAMRCEEKVTREHETFHGQLSFGGVVVVEVDGDRHLTQLK